MKFSSVTLTALIAVSLIGAVIAVDVDELSQDLQVKITKITRDDDDLEVSGTVANVGTKYSVKFVQVNLAGEDDNGNLVH
jgi:hypothetical protein